MECIWGLPQIRENVLGGPILRMIIFWDYIWVPLYWETRAILNLHTECNGRRLETILASTVSAELRLGSASARRKGI